MLTIFQTREEILAYRHQLGAELAFIPTMGALHEGHGSLFAAATAHNAIAMASIFVNPLQFNNQADLKAYPKTLDKDVEIITNEGIRFLFLPKYDDLYNVKEPYPNFDISPIDKVYEGAMRPGHFEGVLKVLYTLFHLVQPDKVFFGQKDLQQCMVVEKLLSQCFPMIDMTICPTVREETGLAMSSRNRRLSADGRKDASIIYKCMLDIAKKLEEGKDFTDSFGQTKDKLAAANIETEYFDFINLPNMDPASSRIDKRQALVFAGYLEGVRLIDNVILL
jgi:pantoate--beta-alanine ligase